MFGYRLVPVQVLDALLAQVAAQSAPVPTVTYTTAPPLSVAPVGSGAPLEPPLPAEVVAAVSVWRGAEAQVSTQAREWLDAGMPPHEVARRIAQGDPVDD
jgi:hypothetical protein